MSEPETRKGKPMSERAKELPQRTLADVLKEQIAIMREIKAPADVIEIAERTLREQFPGDLPMSEPETREAEQKCWHGHTSRQVGCVSCVLVFRPESSR